MTGQTFIHIQSSQLRIILSALQTFQIKQLCDQDKLSLFYLIYDVNVSLQPRRFHEKHSGKYLTEYLRILW